MPDFDPLNEKLKKQYEQQLIYASYRERRTVDAVWKSIVLFERFTNRQPFTTLSTEQAAGFRQWLAKQVTEKGEPLSLATMRSHLASVREFFLWLLTHPTVGRKINGLAIAYFHLSRNEDRAARASKPRQTPTVEQMRLAIETMLHGTDIEKRDRALMAFAAITAMRDAALISLRLKDVDVEARTVWQNPRHVKTKFGKGILSAWVPLAPELEEIVVEWVGYLRKKLGQGDDAPLFPATRVEMNPATQEFEVRGLKPEFWSNAQPVRVVFKGAFERVGLPYFHPHTCRHMLASWVMENGSQLEFKVMSQNLGHEHAMTTYNSYGNIQQDKQVKLIRGMGQRSAALAGIPDNELLAEMLRRRS